MIFLLGGIYVLETLLDNSSTLLSINLWAILKARPSKTIESAMEIVRQVSLEVLNF